VTLDSTWRSGQHVGARRPVQHVRLRRGVMDKVYGPFRHLDGSKPAPFGFIQDGKHNAEPWHGQWRWTEPDWRDLPNVQSVEISQSFSDGGGLTATITVENVVAKAWAGLVGTYHSIERGYLSPLLGFAVAQRIALRRDWSSKANEWLNVLNGGYMIHVEQGYGADVTPAFRGLIDSTDIDVNPDTVTITCRDFNQFTTDQRIFGWNKAREILPPVIFADRLKADNTKPVSSHARASSARTGYPPSAVLKPGTKRYWMSDGTDDPAHYEYIEVDLPAGRYTSYWLYVWGQGAAMDVALKVTGATVNGAPVPDGWVDRGKGNIGGGTTPAIQRYKRVSHGAMERQLGFEVVAQKATLRIYFHNLPYWPVTKDRRIGVARLAGYLRKRKAEAKQKHWILTDDSSDVVKWCLMWAGFHEWEVENSGVRLAKNLVFHQGDFLSQPIKFLTDQGQFVYFMKPPTTHPDSIGVPVFRYSTVLEPKRPVAQVTDGDILTDAQPKWSKESLSYIIRCRGKATRQYQPGGVPLGEDRTKRIQGVYLPPWSGAHHNVKTGLYDHGPGFTDRLAGLRRHRVIYDEGVRTQEEALEMCVLAAIQEAMASNTMSIEVPGNPLLTLDEHVSVIDRASGVNSRLWSADIHSTFTDGTQVEWKITLSGALLDTPDMDLLLVDYENVKGSRSEP
jgi:hypothetical protein